MAKAREDAFKAEGHAAFVVGYTGEVGKELVKELAARSVFSRVVLVGRRTVELPTGPGYEKLEQVVVDFDKIEEHRSVFQGLDVGFCALGTTRGKSGVDGFIKVDHDYVVNVARVAKEMGCRHFNLVTSTGANASSPMLYPKTKGRVEEDTKAIGFEKLTIYRPAVLLCKRAEHRMVDMISRAALTPISLIFPTLATIPTAKVARAMVNSAILQTDAQLTLENGAVHALAETIF